MNSVNRAWLLRVAGLILTVVGIDTVVWHYTTGTMLTALPDLADRARMDGWDVSMGAPARGGWPVRATVSIPDVRVARPDGTMGWSAEGVTLAITPWRPGTLMINADGRQTAFASPGEIVEFRTAESLLEVPLAGKGSGRLRMRDVAGPAWRVGEVDALFEATSMALSVRLIVLLSPLPPPFDGAAEMSLRGDLNHVVADEGSGEERAAAWRDAGGRAALRAFTVRWGPLSVDGTGEGGLDERLRPMGDGVLNVEGALEAITAAAKAQAIGSGTASAARAVVGLLTRGTTGRALTLPVVVRDGTVTVAQFPVAKLPSVQDGLRTGRPFR